MLVQFPTVEAAKAWYDSPLCGKVREYRIKRGDFRCVLAERVR